MADTKTRTTAVGVFEDRRNADKAIDELRKAGFRQDQIGAAMRQDQDLATTDKKAASDETYAEEGALTGIVAGLGLGALAGLGVLAGVVPVIGPAITAGTLGIVLSNAAAGAGIAGIVGALVGWGIPEEEAEYYRDELEAGRTIVTVQAGNRVDEAAAILRRHGAYDMSTRSQAEPRAARTGQARESDTIQVKEERLRADKKPVKTGEVGVRKEVHTETKSMDVPVQHEEVVIERKPVHGRAAEGVSAADIREGEEIRIPVAEEQVNVSKDAVVTEEVKVGKRTVEDTEHVAGRVRKEELKVEQTGDVDVKGADVKRSAADRRRP